MNRLLSDHKATLGSATASFVEAYNSHEAEVATMATVAQPRTFMDQMRDCVVGQHREELMDKLKDSTDTSSEDPTEVLYNRQSALNRIVNISLEKFVFLPVREKVLDTLTSMKLEDEYQLEESLTRLKRSSQSSFGIPDKNQSSSNWASAISHFNQIRREIYVSRMIDSLLNAAKAIYSSHMREHVTAEGEGKAAPLSGDEILPIMCFIIVRSDIICLGEPTPHAAHTETLVQTYFLSNLAETAQDSDEPAFRNFYQTS